jgi:sigma-54-specific transcriptional regulator
MSDLHPAKLLPFAAHSDTKALSMASPWTGSDPHSQQLLRQLTRLAPSEASVLIVGETGTGKEIAARYLHEHSGSRGPFVAVNCGAFSEPLVEAELFGHEAGAFTGAVQARAGWFEAAHGGTLFLDEIGDMPLYLQVKLLRVLQERQVVRLGSRKPMAIDVRVIAATNMELEPAVEARQFRRDLYYRLNVASVRLLPLRARPRDILPLAHFFIDRYRRRLGLGEIALSAAAEQALLAHPWPGNIRELENVVHSGLILCHGGVLGFDDLRLSSARLQRTAGVSSSSSAADALDALGHSLQRLLQSDLAAVYETVERLLLTTAYEHCDRTQVRTAQRLGVSRNMVRAQLKRAGVLARRRANGAAVMGSDAALARS